MKSGAKHFHHSVFRAIAAFPWSWRLLNAVYLKRSPSHCASFHQRSAKGFRDGRIRGRDGYWKVAFGDKILLMPSSSGSFRLDRDNAVSIVGHAIEVKQTYESLIGSVSERPELFIDVGANNGTHSLLFPVHGIETLTFEPNTACHDYFIQTRDLNGAAKMFVSEP